MTIRRPLETLAKIHPEHLASVAQDANASGRFFMAFDGTLERSTEGWAPYEAERRPWRDGRITAKGFDPGFRIILAAMRACRVFGVSPRLLRAVPDAPTAWLERCTARTGHALDVDVDAPGARDDLGAWWWLCMYASPVISCDAAVLDASTLFTIGNGVHFATARFLPKSVLAHAKSEATHAGILAVAPGGSDHGWGMLAVGEAPLIGDLAREGVRRFPADEKQIRVHETLDTGLLSTMEASTFWTGDIDATNFEKRLTATLRRGAKHPEIARDAIRALAAAEGVAIAEGRGPDTSDDGMAHLVATFARQHAERADPVSDATIDLALRSVEAVRDVASWERREYASDEGRAQCRGEIERLRKRLLAAQATRRVRARAPNAVRMSALREVPPRPLRWREITLHAMHEDAVALVNALRDETGATVSIPMSDLSLRAMTSDWETREILATIMDEPFDERVGSDWAKLRTGLPVFVWWPDISPEPAIRAAIDGWESVGWGFAHVTLRGATAERVVRSAWQYPTGSEMKEPKFGGAGPWREVDWRLLRSKVASVKRLIEGPLGGVAPVSTRNTWSLAHAVAEARDGRRVLDRWNGCGELTLPD